MGLLLEEVIICAIDTLIIMWITSLLIGRAVPLWYVAVIFIMGLILADLLFIIGCEGESAIFGWCG